jgi:hypothetical protein
MSSLQVLPLPQVVPIDGSENPSNDGGLASGADKSARKTALAILVGAALTVGGGVIAFTASPLIGGLVALAGVAILTISIYKKIQIKVSTRNATPLVRFEKENTSWMKGEVGIPLKPESDEELDSLIKSLPTNFPTPKLKLIIHARHITRIPKSIARLANLQSVDFSHCYNLTDTASLTACPNLQSVDFSRCFNLTDATAASLAACPNLQSVNLSHCRKLTDATAISLAAYLNLQSVNLSGCHNLTDATAASLAVCPNLQSIDLSHCSDLTDATATSLAACPSLQSVNLSYIFNFTNATELTLAACPNLQSVNLSECYRFADVTPASMKDIMIFNFQIRFADEENEGVYLLDDMRCC